MYQILSVCRANWLTTTVVVWFVGIGCGASTLFGHIIPSASQVCHKREDSESTQNNSKCPYCSSNITFTPDHEQYTTGVMKQANDLCLVLQYNCSYLAMSIVAADVLWVNQHVAVFLLNERAPVNSLTDLHRDKIDLLCWLVKIDCPEIFRFAGLSFLARSRREDFCNYYCGYRQTWGGICSS